MEADHPASLISVGEQGRKDGGDTDSYMLLSIIQANPNAEQCSYNRLIRCFHSHDLALYWGNKLMQVLGTATSVLTGGEAVGAPVTGSCPGLSARTTQGLRYPNCGVQLGMARLANLGLATLQGRESCNIIFSCCRSAKELNS